MEYTGYTRRGYKGKEKSRGLVLSPRLFDFYMARCVCQLLAVSY